VPKNFCQDAVAASTQFGKQGPRVKSVSGAFQVRDAADAVFVRLAGADPTADDDFVTKRWGLANLGGGGSLPPGLPHSDSIIFYVDTADPGSYPGSGTTVTDRAGNATNGTLDGGTVVANGAAQIDAAGKKISFDKNATLDDLFAGGGTVMTFAQAVSMTGSGRFASTENAGNTTGWLIYGGNAFSFDGVQVNLIRRSGGGTDGVWNSGAGAIPNSGAASGGGFSYGSFAVTYNEDVLSNDPTFYTNGVNGNSPAGTNPSALGSDAGTEITLGNRDTGADPMNGQLPITIAWSRILTAEEVLQAHNFFMPRLSRRGGAPGTVARDSDGATGASHILRATGLEAPTIAAGNSGCINLGCETATGKGITGTGIDRAVILSGLNHQITDGDDCGILSGINNLITGNQSGNTVICGGSSNTTNNGNGFLGAGTGHLLDAFAVSSGIVCGTTNRVTTAVGALIGAGLSNRIGAQGTADYGFIGAGQGNDIEKGAWSVIVGGRDSIIGSFSKQTDYAFIGGGQNHSNIGGNHGFIGGGSGHIIADSVLAAICGGTSNTISAGASQSFIGAGATNLVTSCVKSGIVAGDSNQITDCDWGFIGAGASNIIAPQSGTLQPCVIGGGFQNIIRESYGTIGGGQQNEIGRVGGAGGSPHAFIGGGDNNKVTRGAHAVITGGQGNVIGATAATTHSTISGGRLNAIDGADYAWAAGRQAKISHDGAYLWADSTAQDEVSDRANQHKVVAVGGVTERTTVGFPEEQRERFNAHLSLSGAAASGVVVLGTLPTNTRTLDVSNLRIHAIRTNSTSGVADTFASQGGFTGRRRNDGNQAIFVQTLTVGSEGTGGTMTAVLQITGNDYEINVTLPALQPTSESWEITVRWERQVGGQP